MFSPFFNIYIYSDSDALRITLGTSAPLIAISTALIAREGNA